MKHESEVLLVEYVLGNINQDDNKKLNKLFSQKSIDHSIKKATESLDMFTQTDVIKPSDHLRKNILRHIDKSTDHKLSGYSKRLSHFYQLPVKAIDDILAKTTNVQSHHWDKTMLPGASLLHFKGGDHLSTADCGLIHLTPGNGIGKHKHNGDEFMFVLQGYLLCSDNNTYQPGDIVHRPKGSEHSVSVLGDQECIFAVIANHGVTFY